MRKGLATAIAIALAGCSSGGSGSTSFASIAGSTSGAAPVATPTSTAATSSSVSSARIALLPRGISIDGKTRILLGGEVQYFRVRDPAFDAQKTWDLWAKTLDQLQGAGLNLVSTYVPWDYHEEVEGKVDFTGARDLDKFLELCWRRGLVVHLKPGPLINAEWPNGLGSFGGCPAWWKAKNPDSLARGPDGKPFSFDLLGRAAGRQPSLFAPKWRDGTKRWFAAVAPIVKKYVVDRPTIAMLQIDNETNFYFKSRFASDYSSHGLKQYRAWLASKYGAVGALNAAYGTLYASFDDVQPPKTAPSREEDDLATQDWFDAGKAGIAEYHADLRAGWEALGIKEPSVLFTTNDSPHPLPFTDLALWDGPTKNTSGLSFLDAYPKQLPTSGNRPTDYPFLAGFFSKRFDEANDLYPFAGAPVKGRACFAAEIQGGIFEIPLLGAAIPVPDQTTEQVLFDFLGRGGVAGSVYVLRGGLNRDGTKYDFQAAIGADGSVRSRLGVIARYGRLATAHGPALLASAPAEARVAIALDSRLDAPAAGVAGHPGWIQTREAMAVFGWLEDAGLDPEVVDLRLARKGDLDRFQAVFFLNPDAVNDDPATTLEDYVLRGGTLVNLLHAGAHDGAWKRNGVASRVLENGLFSDGNLLRVYENKPLLPGNVNLKVPGITAALSVGPFLGLWSTAPAAEVLARDRTFPLGLDGDVTAWRSARGQGQVFFLATNPASQVYADAGYFDAKPDDIATLRSLARWLGSKAGASPILDVRTPDARAYARTVPGDGAFLFVASRRDTGVWAPVAVNDLKKLGLDPAKVYALEEATTGAPLGTMTGADLNANGVKVSLGSFGTAVVRITPK